MMIILTAAALAAAQPVPAPQAPAGQHADHAAHGQAQTGQPCPCCDHGEAARDRDCCAEHRQQQQHRGHGDRQ